MRDPDIKPMEELLKALACDLIGVQLILNTSFQPQATGSEHSAVSDPAQALAARLAPVRPFAQRHELTTQIHLAVERSVGLFVGARPLNFCFDWKSTEESTREDLIALQVEQVPLEPARLQYHP